MFFDAFIPKGRQQKKLQETEEYIVKKKIINRKRKIN